MSSEVINTDVLIVGTGPSGAAAAKRLVDAGLEVVDLDFRKLPRYKICRGILSSRGNRFLLGKSGQPT